MKDLFPRASLSQIAAAAPKPGTLLVAGVMLVTFDRYEQFIATQLASIFPDNAIEEDINLQLASRFFAGGLAGVSATVVSFISSQPLSQISLLSLRGIGPTLFWIVPCAGVGFMTFQSLQSTFIPRQPTTTIAHTFPSQSQHQRQNHLQHNIPQPQPQPQPQPKNQFPLMSSAALSVETFPRALLLGGFSAVLAHVISFPFHAQDTIGSLHRYTPSVLKSPVALAISLALHHTLQSFSNHNADKSSRNAQHSNVRISFREAVEAARTSTTIYRPSYVSMIPIPSSISTHTTTATTATTATATTTNVPTTETKHLKNGVTTLEGMIAGGVAGAVSKSVIAPLDRTKIMFQVAPDRPFSLRQTLVLLRAIQKGPEGFQGLWKGNGATMARVVPHAAVAYSAYSHLEHPILAALHLANTSSIHASPQAVDVIGRFFAGAAAGATATLITYPLDLFRARMAVHHVSHHQGERLQYMVLARRMVQNEGVMSMYRGLSPTLLGIVPYAGIGFATFETLHAALKKYHNINEDESISVLERLVAGGIAGLLAQSATYPLDIVRRRMQVRGEIAPGVPYIHVIQALKHIAHTEGVAGLYKGLTLNWLKGPVAVAVSFTVNDYMKHSFRKHAHPTSTQKQS